MWEVGGCLLLKNGFGRLMRAICSPVDSYHAKDEGEDVLEELDEGHIEFGFDVVVNWTCIHETTLE